MTMNSYAKHFYQVSCGIWNEKNYTPNPFQPVRAPAQRFYFDNPYERQKRSYENSSFNKSFGLSSRPYDSPRAGRALNESSRATNALSYSPRAARALKVVEAERFPLNETHRCQHCSRYDTKAHIWCNECYTANRCADCKGIFNSLAHDHRCERCDKARRCLRCHQPLSHGYDLHSPSTNFLASHLCQSCEAQTQCSVCKGLFASLKANGRCDRCDRDSRCRKCQKELMLWELSASSRSDLCKMCKYQDDEKIGMSRMTPPSIPTSYSKLGSDYLRNIEEKGYVKRVSNMSPTDRSKRLARYMRSGGYSSRVPLRFM